MSSVNKTIIAADCTSAFIVWHLETAMIKIIWSENHLPDFNIPLYKNNSLPQPKFEFISWTINAECLKTSEGCKRDEEKVQSDNSSVSMKQTEILFVTSRMTVKAFYLHEDQIEEIGEWSIASFSIQQKAIHSVSVFGLELFVACVPLDETQVPASSCRFDVVKLSFNHCIDNISRPPSEPPVPVVVKHIDSFLYSDYDGTCLVST